MKTYNFTNPQGQSLTVNSPDGSMPSEQDLDKMFSMAPKSAGQNAMAANKVNPAMQGGANSPALTKAKYDMEAAKSRTNPIMTNLKGLSDTADQIGKVVPFGDRTQTLNPLTPQGRSNLAGESLKASSLIPGVGPIVGSAAYGAGMGIEDPKKSAGGVATESALMAGAGKLGEAVLPVLAKGAKAVGKGIMDLMPKPVTERIYKLYNDAIKPRVGQFKVKGDLESYKKDQLQSTMSIKDNPNLHFEDTNTGEIYHQPRNKQDYLDAIDQTQKSVWKDKVQAMSQGATAKGVFIDTEAITKKALSSIVNNKNMKLVAPELVKEAEGLIERAKVSGRQTPEEVEDLLKILNNKGATYWANKDKNAANAYVELAGALRKEMEDKIESALQQGGYLDARKEYGALKRIKADVLKSTAQQIFRGDTTLGDKLLDTFAGEELVRGLMTMRPESIAMSGTTKAYQLLRQYLRNPDRKISQMFELAQKYSPKATASAQSTWAHAQRPRPTMTSGQPNVSNAQIMAKRLPGQSVQESIGQDKKLGLPDKSWENSDKTEIRPQPKFEGDEGKKPIYIPKVGRSESARYQPNASKESVMDLRKEKPDASKGVSFLTNKAKTAKSMKEFVESQNPKTARDRSKLMDIYRKAKDAK